MEYTIEFGGEPERVTITTSGRAEREDIFRYMEELAADPGYRPGMPVLADHRAVDWSTLTTEDVKAISARTSSLVDTLGTGPYAIVVPDTLGFGIARMAEAQITPELRMAIFYSLDEALAWLDKATANR